MSSAAEPTTPPPPPAADTPALDQAQRLHPAIGWVTAVPRTLFWLVAGGVGLVVGSLQQWPAVLWLLAHPAAMALLGTLLLCYSLLPVVAMRRWRWLVQPHAFVLHRGLFVQRVVMVPLARVQQVDTHSGVLDRWFGMSTIQVHSAGSRAARVDVPGIPSATAEALRSHLARVADTDAT